MNIENINTVLILLLPILVLLIALIILLQKSKTSRLLLESQLISEKQLLEQQLLQIQQQQLEQRQTAEKQIVQLESTLADLKTENQQLKTVNSTLQNSLNSLEEKHHQAELANSALNSEYQQAKTELSVNLSNAEQRLVDLQNMMLEKERLHQENEQRLSAQFENLAKKIVEQSGTQLATQNQQGLLQLLSPLKEQLDNFRKQVNEGLTGEARERHTLKHEIVQLQTLNQRLANEALNLTKALKSDNKIQGNWGEFILARLLETVGLQEGREFVTQVSLKSEDDKRLQPDVIVYLPENRQVIIDAKVSLIAYERYFNAVDEAEQNVALQEHLNSIRQHIRNLSSKNYQQLAQIQTLDYVLMFIPIEPAFMLALQEQDNLLSDALKQNIMLVSPSTLLVALRTIENMWRTEYKNQNANLIADRASKLYDKFRLFLDDLQNVGASLNKTQQSYELAINKLSTGRGNIIKQVEGFRDLGIDIKKQLGETWLEKSLDNETDVANDSEIINAKSTDISSENLISKNNC